jgi:hypothetical protein
MSDEKGHIYRIDWPEYHLHCGGCNQHITLTATGFVFRKSEAEALLKKGQTEDDSTGWHKKKWSVVLSKLQVKQGSPSGQENRHGIYRRKPNSVSRFDRRIRRLGVFLPIA